jgi:hypothetical protein
MKAKHVRIAAEHLRLLEWAEAVRGGNRSVRVACPSIEPPPGAPKAFDLPDWLSNKILDLVVQESKDALESYGVTRD